MVGVNVPIPMPVASSSFGGCKQSLSGDLHVHGREDVLSYTHGKVVTVGRSAPRASTTASQPRPERSQRRMPLARAVPTVPRTSIAVTVTWTRTPRWVRR